MLTRSGFIILITSVVLGIVLMIPAYAQSTTQSASPLGNKDVGKTETAVGDLVADSVRAMLRTDFAFISASELKLKDPPIPAGTVSSTDIAALVSYTDDPLAVVELTGKAIRQALEKAVSIYPQPNLGFLQVSGMKFSFDPSRSAGDRVISALIGSAAVDDNRTYTVAVTNSMANGALGYWKVWTNDNVTRRVADANIEKAVEKYFTSNPKIDYGNPDRIMVR